MKSQIKILLLLVVALAAFGAYALSDADWSESIVPFKKTDLTTLRDTAAAHRAAQTAQAKAAQQRKAHKVEKDTTKQRILFLGDSMLEGLSQRLRDYAEANGHELNTVIWYSSSSKAWAECDTLEFYCKRFQPTYVVVCLGANELFVKDLEKRRGYVQRIVEKLGDLPFVWIGPPNWKPDTGINSIIREKVGDERFFDSSHLQLARKKDGAHPTTSASAEWMDAAAEWWASPETAHPILLNKPDRHYASRNVFTLQPYEG